MLRFRGELGEYAAGAMCSVHCRPSPPKQAGARRRATATVGSASSCSVQQCGQALPYGGLSALCIATGKVRQEGAQQVVARGEAHMARRSKEHWRFSSRGISCSSILVEQARVGANGDELRVPDRSA